MITSCEGCKSHGISRVYRSAGACYPRKTFTDGKVNRPPADGFPTEHETGHIDIYENRLASDHCGPERRNYVARV